MRHYCVISHTHWDREWYQTQEQMRLRLVDLMDNLLDILDCEPEYVFHLDAQTVMLEDYWDVRPEMKEKCCDYIRAGRMLVGPWYVQNEFLLTSGEATVRNLHIGMAQAERYGRCMRVGYAPDQFGLISQLPQILNGVGLDACVFGRGHNIFCVDDQGRLVQRMPPAEFRWQSPDGSEVFAVCMSFWYNNTQRFSANIDKAMELLRWQEEHFKGIAQTDFLLLMNGCDHIEPQNDLMDVLKKMQARLPEGSEIHQDTLESYLSAVRGELKETSLGLHVGEMLQGVNDNTLKDTNSSRIYLKIRNAELQNLLENRLEPLYAVLEMAGLRGCFPKGHLNFLWRMLIRNHAHDSICGCSKDAVHRHMEDRFDRIAELGYGLLERGMELLAAHVRRDGMDMDDYMICVANPLSRPRTECVDVALDVLCADHPKGVRVFDAEGNEVPFVLLGRETLSKRVISPLNLPGFIEVERFRLRLTAKDVPACGALTWRVTTEAMSERMTQPENGSAVLENRFLRAEVDAQGRLTLTNKETGRAWRDALALEDSADTGHSYVSLPLEGDKPIRMGAPLRMEARKDAMRQSLTMDFAFRLPRSLTEDRSARSAETVDCPVRLTLSLDADSRALDVEMQIDNKAKDHRLRAVVRTGLDSDFTQALSPFDVVTHDKREIDTRICNETRHNSGFVSIADGENRMTVENAGVYGYENLQSERGTLALTVLRATGRVWPEEATGAPEDDAWLAPENQCLRAVRIHLALRPGRADEPLDALTFASLAFQNPLLVGGYAVDGRKFLGGRPALQDANIAEFFYPADRYPEAKLPRRFGMLTLEGGAQVTACKLAMDGDAVILRMFNPADSAAQMRLRASFPTRAIQTDLRELADLGELARQDGAFDFELAPKRIATLRLERE